MTTERTIIAILVAFIIGVLLTGTSVVGSVLDPVTGGCSSPPPRVRPPRSTWSTSRES